MEINLKIGQPSKNFFINGAEQLASNASSWSLLFSNLFTIYFAATQHWSIGPVLWIYWCQSIIIGLFNFIRIIQLKEFSTEGYLVNNHPVEPTKSTKLSTAFFFVVHYGGFHLVYFVFLLIASPDLQQGIINIADVKYVLLSVCIFFLNHLFSYLYNRPRDTKKQNIGTLLFYPYARIIPMHIMMILGFAFSNSIILFLILKTVADLIMHGVEHSIKKAEGPQI